MATDKKIPKIPPVKQIQVENPEDWEAPELKALITPPPSYGYCPHDLIRIWPHHRLVKCRECQAVLDPFQYLLDVAQKEEYELSYIKQLRWERKRLQEEIEQLKKEKSKLKSEIKKGKI